jgi:hypothetical protein
LGECVSRRDLIPGFFWHQKQHKHLLRWPRTYRGSAIPSLKTGKFK